MIKCNGKTVEIGHFPDGTLLLHHLVENGSRGSVSNHIAKSDHTVENDHTAESDHTAENGSNMENGSTSAITWLYDNNEEMVALYFLVRHLRAKGVRHMTLYMPYIPNARQDRVKRPEDVFTLKYFAQWLNALQFDKVKVLDPHSYVSEALIDHIEIETPVRYVNEVLKREEQEPVLFFPDEGAMKRYSAMFSLPYVFGIKKRDWATGEIKGLEVAGQTEFVKGKNVLMIDDICSRGGTFFHSAAALKQLGAKEIRLYISHCENAVFEGELLKTDIVKKIYTTNSIYRGEHEKIEVIPLRIEGKE